LHNGFAATVTKLRLGWSPVGGLDRSNALEDARSEAFSSINGEAGGDDFAVWLPCLMITGKANGQSFKSSLASSHHSVGAGDVPDLWANGRRDLPDKERLGPDWAWHCAPLDEWDGKVPRDDANPPNRYEWDNDARRWIPSW
jgi:hypothetical protein